MSTFTHAKVFTGEGPDVFASAFTVVDGRFSWVGDASEVSDPAAVDLGGATVVPGLLDVHTHPAFMAVLADNVWLLQPTVRSLTEMLDALRTHPALGRGPDAWVMGYGYNEDQWDTGAPTRRDLDRVSTTQPVFARRADGHNAVCNTFALRLAGLTDDTPDPAGGRLGRDDDGHLDGRLIEANAVDLVARHCPLPDRDELVRRLVSMNEHYLSFGLVTLDDMWGDFVPDPLGTFREARARGFLPRVAVMLLWGDGGLPTLTDADRTGDVHVAGVKVFMDGAFASRTAWVEEPYPDSDEHGIVTVDDDHLRAACAWARANAVQLAVHVMGDRGVAHLLDLFEDEEPWLADRPSIRFDHSAIYPQHLIERTVRARMSFGLISHTVFFFAEWDSYRENLRPSVFPAAYPIRSFYEQVEATALASDSPATAWVDCDDPFLSVYAAVTRKTYDGHDFNPDQAVSVGEALELVTSRAALVTTTRGVGSIVPGNDGDFVVLDRDPFTIPAAELREVRVTRTFLRGQEVYTRA